IENTTGSRYFDFELYRTNLIYDRSTLTFQGYGPDAGHTSWVFDALGNIVTPGDIIFTAEFSSSTLTLVEARIWVHEAELDIIPATFNWGGKFDGDGAGAVYGYASILPKTVGAFYAGIQCTAVSTWAGPFALIRENNTLVNTYIARQFMEFSVNLSKLGIDPASYSNDPCGSPFLRVLIKTRASTAFTAELKDFVAPYKMFDYPKVDANAYLIYFCGTMPSTTIDVYNPLSTSTYNWNTTNGNIVGATTGTSITVNKPGTYYVTQQLHTQCPTYAIDSVTIQFDSVCNTLNVDITRFDAFLSGKFTELRWEVNNNDLVADYEIEYSSDNRVFKKLVNIPADGRSGLAEYAYRYIQNNNDLATFYRIRIIGKNGVTKYSSTVLLRSRNDAKRTTLIFPNPVKGEAWLSLESSEKSVVTVYISEITGRLVKTFNLPVNMGNNMIPLREITEQKNGIYILKVKSKDGETTQKVIVTK
ncbi:MAG: T9SS type A sorting domain-containing protein, partial [Chitinophagaceae bacterium]